MILACFLVFVVALLVLGFLCIPGLDNPPGYGYDDDPWWKPWGKKWWKD